MKLGIAEGRIVRWSPQDSSWITAGREVPADVAELLDGTLSTVAEPADAPSGLPFVVRSLRGAMVVESHYVRSARTLVSRFMPRPVSVFIAAYEGVTRTTFPPLRPPPRFYEAPAFYIGSHLSIVADGATVTFPSTSRFRDFELELGAIITKAWDSRRDGVPKAADVIGAFTVINDFSARDLQWRDERRGAFGGVIKAKSFATGMASTIVTADEILPRWGDISGRVHVNGELWCEGDTGGAHFSLDEIVAEIADGEQLVPGELISLGTLAGCCGLEIDRFLEPGDTVRLELDGVGTLTNSVATR